MLWQRNLSKISLTCPVSDLARTEASNLDFTMLNVVSTLDRLWYCSAHSSSLRTNSRYSRRHRALPFFIHVWNILGQGYQCREIGPAKNG